MKVRALQAEGRAALAVGRVEVARLVNEQLAAYGGEQLAVPSGAQARTTQSGGAAKRQTTRSTRRKKADG